MKNILCYKLSVQKGFIQRAQKAPFQQGSAPSFPLINLIIKGTLKKSTENQQTHYKYFWDKYFSFAKSLSSKKNTFEIEYFFTLILVMDVISVFK